MARNLCIRLTRHDWEKMNFNGWTLQSFSDSKPQEIFFLKKVRKLTSRKEKAFKKKTEANAFR